MSRGRAASRKDVALRAGVAPSTVSLVLNKTPGLRIAPETRNRVEAAARELGYQSSAIARALVTGRSNTIGVVIHYLKQPFQSYASGVLDGAWDVLLEHGYRMLLSVGTPEACLAGQYRERVVDALLVLAPPLPADDQELLDVADAGFPTVCIGARPRSCLDRLGYADIDNVAAGRRCAEILLEAGHRRIAHVAGPLELSTVAGERLAGVRQAMRAAGLELGDDKVIDCSWNAVFAHERFGAALDRGLDATAIVCGNHGMAFGCIRALQERGRSVPGDMSITAIDAVANPECAPILVTHLAQPLHEVGAQAGRILLDLLSGRASGVRQVLLPCTEVAGNSVGPPSG